jgi:hypothetical protein
LFKDSTNSNISRDFDYIAKGYWRFNERKVKTNYVTTRLRYK